MDEMQFIEQAGQDPEIRSFLSEIADSLGEEKPEGGATSGGMTPKFALGGLEFLIPIVSFALYRWIKDYFDDRRNRDETEIARQRLALVNDLVAKGVPLEQAQTVVTALFDQILKRGADDPVLALAAKMIGKAN